MRLALGLTFVLSAAACGRSAALAPAPDARSEADGGDGPRLRGDAAGQAGTTPDAPADARATSDAATEARATSDAGGDAGDAPDAAVDGVPPPSLTVLPAPACVTAPPVGQWYQRGCGPRGVTGVAIDPADPRHQYAYGVGTGAAYQLVAVTKDGWATSSPLTDLTNQPPVIDRATGGLWLLGDTGLLRWTDPATTPASVHANGGAFAVAGLNGPLQRIYVPTDGVSLTIEASSDEGHSWTPHDLPDFEPIGPFEYRLKRPIGNPNNPDRVWVDDAVRHRTEGGSGVHYVYVLARSEDAGVTWTECRRSDTDATDFSVGAHGVLYLSAEVSGGGGGPSPTALPVSWRVDDGCKVWTPLSKSCRVLTADPGSEDVFCVENLSGSLWRSADRGQTWAPIDAGVLGARGIAPVPGQARSAYVAGYAGLFRVDGDTTWSRLSSGEPTDVDNLVAVDGNLYAVSTSGYYGPLLLVSNDAGQSWQTVPPESATDAPGRPKLLLPGAVVTTADKWRSPAKLSAYLGDPHAGLAYDADATVRDFGDTIETFGSFIGDNVFRLASGRPPNADVIYGRVGAEMLTGTVVVSHDAGASWSLVPLSQCQQGGLPLTDTILTVSDVDPETFYVRAPSCLGAPLTLRRSDGGLVTALPIDLPAPPAAPRRALTVEPNLMLLLYGGGADSLPTVVPFPNHLGNLWRDGSPASSAFLDGANVPGAPLDGTNIPGALAPGVLLNDPARPSVVHAGDHSFVFPAAS